MHLSSGSPVCRWRAYAGAGQPSGRPDVSCYPDARNCVAFSYAGVVRPIGATPARIRHTPTGIPNAHHCWQIAAVTTVKCGRICDRQGRATAPAPADIRSYRFARHAGRQTAAPSHGGSARRAPQSSYSPKMPAAQRRLPSRLLHGWQESGGTLANLSPICGSFRGCVAEVESNKDTRVGVLVRRLGEARVGPKHRLRIVACASGR